ncbi:MAG: (2Fe-2S)-binding protein [Spirochaetota bacterium]
MKSDYTISLVVNGNPVTRTLMNPSITLADFLRDELGLTGTKIGCNRGECGSCTVIFNNKAVYSCSMLASSASGGSVITVEGLAENNNLHPLQRAFIQYDALQCGFCTPGMIMSMLALLAKTPDPTEDEIKTAIEGNVCRCGCYQNIVLATQAYIQDRNSIGT